MSIITKFSIARVFLINLLLCLNCQEMGMYLFLPQKDNSSAFGLAKKKKKTLHATISKQSKLSNSGIIIWHFSFFESCLLFCSWFHTAYTLIMFQNRAHLNQFEFIWLTKSDLIVLTHSLFWEFLIFHWDIF